MLLSILIPTHDYNAYPLVQSLHQQAEALSVPYEMILVEDGSHDSVSMIANLKTQDLSRCRYIRRKENVGRSAIRNFLMDESKGDYYRDYAADGLTMHFKSVKDGVTGMDGDYAMTQGDNNILLVYEGKNIKVTNAFHPGAMPMQIVSQFPGEGEASAVETVKAIEKNDAPVYNLAGQRTTSNYKGIVIKGGKKYFQR